MHPVDVLVLYAELSLAWLWTDEGFPDFSWVWKGQCLAWDPVRAGSWMLN